MASLHSVINSVLGNLESAAIFGSNEVQVNALLDRRPHRQMKHNEEKSLYGYQFIFVNDAQPKWGFELQVGGVAFVPYFEKWTRTPFLKLDVVAYRDFESIEDKLRKLQASINALQQE